MPDNRLAEFRRPFNAAPYLRRLAVRGMQAAARQVAINLRRRHYPMLPSKLSAAPSPSPAPNLMPFRQPVYRATIGRRRRRSAASKARASRTRRFTKRVKRALIKSSDKKFVTITNYLQTSVLAAGAGRDDHIQNHRGILIKMVNPSSTANGGLAMGSPLSFPTLGDGTGQYEGRGYHLKGLLLRWTLRVGSTDERLAIRLYHMKSKIPLTLKNGANDLGVFWRRYADALSCVNETTGELLPEYSIVNKWDLHTMRADYADPSVEGRQGKIFIPFKRNVSDAALVTTIDGVTTLPRTLDTMANHFFLIVAHSQGADTGTDLAYGLNGTTALHVSAELHYADL